MKALETIRPSPIFPGVVDAVAAPVKREVKGRLARLARWFWNRQMRGVGADIARADGTFAALDRWLWKQRMRETEAWLAGSFDLFELEARIRELERRQGRGGW